jgi:predicted transcriptional regulator
MMNSLEAYNKTHKIIQSIYSSRLKIQILLSLANGMKSLSDLREVTGSTSQALIPKIRGLEKLSLIEQKERGYDLTPLGSIVTTKIEDFVITMGEIHQHRDFWANHDLAGIPASFLDQLGDLLRSDVTYDTTTDILHVYSNFLKILKEAHHIMSISSMMSPGLAESLLDRVVAGIPVDLIVDQSIVTLLVKEPYAEGMRTLMSMSNFHVWVADEPLRIAFTVTDKYFSLGLNTKDGKIYDSTSDLVSNDPKAIEWGTRLFHYYKERSNSLKL